MLLRIFFYYQFSCEFDLIKNVIKNFKNKCVDAYHIYIDILSIRSMINDFNNF